MLTCLPIVSIITDEVRVSIQINTQLTIDRQRLIKRIGDVCQCVGASDFEMAIATSS
jgi:hypothetical protein